MINKEILILGGLAAAWAFTAPKSGAKSPPQAFQRGMKLLTPGQLNHRLHGWAMRRQGTKIGQVIIPRRLETEHFLICGASGGGKSTLARHIVEQVVIRGLPAIIIDPHGELAAEFYREGKDWLLNPADERCPYWGPELEIRGPIDIEGLAWALLRRDQTSWDAYARDLIAALLTINAATLPTLIDLPPKELHERLPETAKGLFDPSERATAQRSAIIGTALRAIKPLRSLARKDERHWSAREWGINPEGRIFLTSDARNRAATLSMQGVWFDLLIRELLAHRKTPQTLIVACELPTMGYQPRFAQVLAEGRKYRLSTVIEFQGIAQMREIYGHDGAMNIAGGAGVNVLLNPGKDPETATWARKVIGNYELEPDVQLLKAGEAYLAIKGYESARINIKPRKPAPEAIFIERETGVVETVDTLDKQKVARERKRLAAIISRCHKPSDPGYKDYGARGITVYPAWRQTNGWKMYVNYLLMTIGLPVAENFSLDRVDNDKNYEPANLRWSTREQQAANRRTPKTKEATRRSQSC